MVEIKQGDISMSLQTCQRTFVLFKISLKAPYTEKGMWEAVF